VTEKIFVSTVHKAKGLEFENVVVFGCVDGVYPFFASKDDPVACQEDARKLYVAMTRARKRLCFLSFNKRTGISRWGNPYSFDVPVSPFLIGVLSKFHFTTT
jgi:DNA helicase-2/ATP-dependent DNA helicase PcrA